MKNRTLVHTTALAATLTLVGGAAQAGPIAHWKALFDNGDTLNTTSGLDTDSPTFGGGAEEMDAVAVAGRFGTVGSPESVTLGVGETLTVSMDFVLTGGNSDPNQIAQHYRFAVLNDGGQFAADSDSNWAGGWNHELRQEINRAGTDGNFMSTAGNAEALPSIMTESGTFNGDSTAPYNWTMSITRDSATTVDLVSTVAGGDGAYTVEMVNDDVTTDVFTYTAVGLQSTGVTDLDEWAISEAQYAVIPEPSSLALLGLGGLLVARRHRG